MPQVIMSIDSRYQFPKDTFASILTSGLIGEQYIGLGRGRGRGCAEEWRQDHENQFSAGLGRDDRTIPVQQGVGGDGKEKAGRRRNKK